MKECACHQGVVDPKALDTCARCGHSLRRAATKGEVDRRMKCTNALVAYRMGLIDAQRMKDLFRSAFSTEEF